MSKPLLVNEIKQVGEAMRFLLEGGLTERALVILVSDATGVSITNVQKVIKFLPKLDKTYVREQK